MKKEGMRMTKYVLKRLLYMVIVFLLVSLLMYSIYNLIPTDPARAELEPMKNTLTPTEYEARYQALRAEMGLDDPLIIRYLRWFGFWPDVDGKVNGMIQGNFGYSQKYKTDVVNILPSRMLNTIYINIFSTLVALAITIPLGIACAVHKRGKLDNTVQVLSIVGYSIPVYIIALVFIWLFAVTLRWLPVVGMETPGNNFTGWRAFWDKIYYMTLPVLVMTVGSLGGMTRYVRAAMIESLSMDYIRTARAKGLSEHKVIYLMTEWYDFRKNSVEVRDEASNKGGTLRLGAYPCSLLPGTRAAEAYKQEEISERHRHRYEFNNAFRETLSQHGMVFSGTSPDGTLVEIVELPDHPWFVGCQFHPEFKSRPMHAHPLFKDFIAAAVKQSKKK